MSNGLCSCDFKECWDCRTSVPYTGSTGKLQDCFCSPSIRKRGRSIMPCLPKRASNESMSRWRASMRRLNQTHWRIENRLEPGEPWYLQRIVEGQTNAITEIELVDLRSGFGRFQLFPRTGKKHQLRIHMSSIGCPIAGDVFYPTIRKQRVGDSPMQLIARRLAFIDPLTWSAAQLYLREELDRTFMISLSHIGKQYGRQILFVDASFQLNPGEKVGLVGPNGSGKTTLFRMITGEESPDEGERHRTEAADDRLFPPGCRGDVGPFRAG